MVYKNSLYLNHLNNRQWYGIVVGEEDEISIKDAADAIVKSIGLTGDYDVSGFYIQQNYVKGNLDIFSMIC